MSEDFGQGLRDLYVRAAAAHAGGDGFPTTAMVATARRNRQVRAGAVAAATVAAVVGVGFGGAAAVRTLDADPPLPPAQTTSAPTPTRATEGSSSPSCGALIADLPALVDAPVTIEATLKTSTVAPADPLTGSLVIAAVNPPEPWIMPEVADGLQYAVVSDGVVVGLGRDVGESPASALSGRSGAVREVQVDLAACGADGPTAEDLRPGRYDLYAWIHVAVSGAPEDPVPGGPTLLLGGPWPITVTDAGAPPAVVGTRANPACGMDVSELRTFAVPPAAIDVALDPRSMPSTGYLTGGLEIVGLDPGWGTTIRPSVWNGLEYAAVQDGEIVALPSFEETTEPGTSYPLRSCAGRDGDLAPGEYEFWAFIAATIDGVDAYLTGGPWRFTVTTGG